MAENEELILNNDCPVTNPDNVVWPWDEDHAEDRTDMDKCDTSPDKMLLSTSPSGLSRYYVTLLQGFFANPNNIIRNGLRNSIKTQQPVYVTDMSGWDPKDTSTFPRIIVSFEGKKKQNNFAFNNINDYDIANGSRSYVEYWHIAHTIYAIAKTKISAEDLGDLVAQYFTYFQQKIGKEINSERIQVLELTKAQSLSTSENTAVGFMCATSILHTTPDAWTVFDAAPVTKRIDITQIPTLDLRNNLYNK